MRPPQRIEDAARARVARAESQIRRSVHMAAQGTPLAAEPDPERLVRRLETKRALTRSEAGAMAGGIYASAAERESAHTVAPGPERIYGGTSDFVGVSFLTRGVTAAKAVARIATPSGQALGTGFLVSDRLLVTNNHVIGSAQEAGGLVAEFDYELGLDRRAQSSTTFRFDPGAFFETDGQDDLDFTLIALGARSSGSGELDGYGCCVLSDANDKHALGEVANIVQHPDGRYKEVVLRENRLVSRLETVLHYIADTEPGSSGSPVFNNEWQVVALHHWGGPHRQSVDDAGGPLDTEINEGIRISAIVGTLEERARRMPLAQRTLLEAALRHGERTVPTSTASAIGRSVQPEHGARLEPDGRVTWTVPIEISVRLPHLASAPPPPVEVPKAASQPVTNGDERRREFDTDYEARKGYKPSFIEGHVVALPKLTAAQRKVAARNRQAETGDDPLELPYHHFSVVMNAERRLAFFTACNIDGKTAKEIDRQSGKVTPRVADADHQEALSGAEASERWLLDPRLQEGESTSDAFYAKQEVPGTTRGSGAFMKQMFQRGHLVRRVDPAWGSDEAALSAEADTFHHTNCSPQVGAFNMGTAAPRPGTGGGQLWRAIEDYVLENAVAEKERVCVFTGPVMRENDPPWREDQLRGFRVPLQFWKVVVWSDHGTLRSRALLADQSKVLDVMPEAVAERFAELELVQDFVTTVAEIERLTGLTFPKNVRDADVGASEAGGSENASGAKGVRLVRSWADISLKPAKERKSAATVTSA